MKPRPITLKTGMRVTGRLASDAGGNYPADDYADGITNPGPDAGLFCGLFGAALATGTVVRTVRERPPVALIERPSGKRAVVLVTRVMPRG